jgi:uncharacterized membrane protein (DUF373 family)
MDLKTELIEARDRWHLLTAYEKFEQAIIAVLTALIALIVVLAVWNLIVKVVGTIILTGSLDPTDYAVFQALFGMIMTVIIALEFRRSLLVSTQRDHGVVQVRTVVLIALLAIVRKLLILDFSATDADVLFGLSAAILALGGIYWIVRDQDRRDADGPTAALVPRPKEV